MRPHAEIAEVWPRDGRIRVLGRIHGVPAEGTWRLVLTRRSHTGPGLRYDAAVQGDRFESELPVGDLTASEHAPVEEWDIHLTDGEVELRAGKHLDDVRGKKRIFGYPEQSTGCLRVRPYCTIKDNLSLECRTGGPA